MQPREEKAHDRLAGDYASEKKLSLVTAMEKKQRKIAALMQGHTLPFNVHFVVRAWDRTKDGLAAKLGVIKNAIHGMNGAQYFECTLPTTSKRDYPLDATHRGVVQRFGCSHFGLFGTSVAKTPLKKGGHGEAR